MPITITFDVRQPTPQELTRLRCGFERLGWEHLGNTAYRYPKLRELHPVEDWFNHVIPALMLLRSFARFAAASGRDLTKFSIDVQSSTGFNPAANVGTPPLQANAISYWQPEGGNRSFGMQNLQDWIDGVTWPYPTPPGAGTAGT